MLGLSVIDFILVVCRFGWVTYIPCSRQWISVLRRWRCGLYSLGIHHAPSKEGSWLVEGEANEKAPLSKILVKGPRTFLPSR